MAECGVCCYPTSVKNHSIICGFCDFTACKNCCEKYLTDTHEDPHCMNCRNEWKRDVIVSNFSKAFVQKRLKEHRENVLFDREKALLPMSQVFVDEYVAAKEKKERLSRLYSSMAQVEAEIVKVNAELVRVKRECVRCRETKNALHDNLWELQKRLRSLKEDAKRENVRASKKHAAEIVGKCPLEGCKGYIRNDWTCGVCSKRICRHCFDEDGEKHVCDKSDVASMKTIRRDTRSCPGCGACVYRVDGCDQMWCVMAGCHTAFSWSTGEVITGHLHNPHYIEWVNNTPGAVEEPPREHCDGLPGYRSLVENVKKLTQKPEHIEALGNAYGLVSHIIDVELPKYPNNEPDPRENGMIRAQYLLNVIDENTFKAVIQRREKRREKMKDFGSVLTMFTTVSSDLFRNISEKNYEDCDSRKYMIEQFKTMVLLGIYTRDAMTKVGKNYGCKQPACSSRIGFGYPYSTLNKLKTVVERIHHSFIGLEPISRMIT